MHVQSLSRLVILLGCLILSPVRAEVVVLVHGWSANADTWLYNGVSANLASRGWIDVGVILPGPLRFNQSAQLFPTHSVYRAALTAEAPLLLQAEQLQAQLWTVHQRHPREALTLVGHSAGGLVARLALVRPQAPPVQTLITLGSPNLGTVRASQGLDIIEEQPFFCPGPGIDFLKSAVGGQDYRYLRASRAALYDLQPAGYGSLLDWLNHQPHPDIAYFAVIRGGPVGAGDELVPAFSQDLNRVPALLGRARTLMTPTGHRLQPQDGQLIADILAQN